MNKIVREHYPVSRLPEDLRAELVGRETVKLVIEEEETEHSAIGDIWSLRIDEIPPMTSEQFRRDLESLRRSGLPNVTPDQAVARIRELRDEWDDR